VTAVQVQSVVKRFDEICALDGVSLVVDEGEVRGLLGPNGAGKTTLLRILFGLIRPDAGTVELFGRSLELAQPEALEGVAGFVEDPTFYPYLSGRVNLELLGELDGGVNASRIDEVLERVGLAHRGADRVNGYSTGMIQRLGIAAALLRSPRLLMLDEPTSGLDPGGVREVGSLVRELSADGVTVLLSSHQIVEVEEICHSFTVLRKGRVAWDGPASRLRAQAPASAYRLLTSDDDLALSLAERHPGIGAVGSESGGLELTVEVEALDGFVLALGSAGVAVRRLELLASPVETMFFALTGETGAERTEPLRVNRAAADA
jgi:ABC-2 type transport system ATP-binding protein